ncbi:HvfC/BufC N-terminal domain-containing protein [Streptomyces albireticuli]|uniref:HvfC/BufC N-terminal domain-containing protein n=1 Tax=Streptomyces albireticuli TaxID=1940 RepID=UPI00369713B8
MQAALLAPGRVPHLAEVFTASATQSAEERFRVYHRGYRLRLLRCMRLRYPAMLRLLGRELFERFALDHLDANPSRSPVLDALGDDFPDHLARTRPDTAGGGPPEAWIDLLIDLARFERDFTAVLDGPDTGENGGALLFEARFPVHRYAAAVRHGEEPEPPGAEPVRLSLTRRDGTVVVHDPTDAGHRARRATVRPSPAA